MTANIAAIAFVADEGRVLAEKTTITTNQILEMIQNIQNRSAMAVKSMHAGTKDVESCVQLARRAGESV